MSWKKVIMALGLAIILTACSGDSVEDKIHTHLEEAVELEQDFETLQVEITELEKQLESIAVVGAVKDVGEPNSTSLTKPNTTDVLSEVLRKLNNRK